MDRALYGSMFQLNELHCTTVEKKLNYTWITHDHSQDRSQIRAPLEQK